GFKMTFIPEAADLLQRPVATYPPPCDGWFWFARLPGSPGNLWRDFKQSRFRMDKKQISVAPRHFHNRHDAASAIADIEHADLSFVHESVPLDEFQQMRFDVRANDAVGLDDRACF